MTQAPLSVAAARAIDLDAATRLGMPTLLLMENAARSVAELAVTLGERFVVLCGSGNNGGDGLAAVRHLGVARCKVHLLAEPDPARAADAALQLRILRNAGVPIVVGGLPSFAVAPGTVFVDALFGTGLASPLEGLARQWVDGCNAAAGRRLAVDLPSGLHGDTGAVLGAAIRADATVTFVAPKLGMLQGAGPVHCGRIVVAGLGLP
jgi:NAD(P)H-hydrate epimerase